MDELESGESLLAMMQMPAGIYEVSHQDYREGYVRGYAESATTLLNICEIIFADTVGIEYVRARFAAKVEDAAIKLDEITTMKRDGATAIY